MRPEHVEALAAAVALNIKSALAPLLERVALAEARLATMSDVVQKDTTVLSALRERVAVVETREPVPGPPGEPGPPGKDGLDGKDGAPGLEWKGIYHDDKTYDPGQIAKWGGSTYVCMKTTTGIKPDAMPQRTVKPDGGFEHRGVSGKDYWDLFVSKGDPGKAAK